MTTGLVLTTPGGTKFWHPCKDAATGLREMESVKFVYGKAWDDAETVVEFVERDGLHGPYTVRERVRGPAPAKETT